LQSTLNSLEANCWTFCERAFPNPHNAPTGGAQSSTDAPITATIPGYLCSPHTCVACWLKIPTTTVAVPKATVNEHRKFCVWKNEVRIAKQRKTTTPTTQSRRAKKRK